MCFNVFDWTLLLIVLGMTFFFEQAKTNYINTDA